MKPARVKAAVEGADVRAEGEAVTGVEVVAEDATNNFPDYCRRPAERTG
jgi:hypothetical protein